MSPPSVPGSTTAVGGEGSVPPWFMERRKRRQDDPSGGENPGTAPTVEMTGATAPPQPQPSPEAASEPPPVSSGDAPTGELPAKLPPPPVTGSIARPDKVKIKAEKRSYLPKSASWLAILLLPTTTRGMALSAAIHFSCAAVLSWVFITPEITQGIHTLWSGQAEERTDLGLEELPAVEMAGGAEAPPVETLLNAQDVESLQAAQLATLDSMPSIVSKGQGKGTGDGTGDGNADALAAGGFQMPEGGKVVRKGSFSVWTVPTDPKPGEDYRIVVQVQYPKKTQKLRPGDITGLVIGTDRFRKVISITTAQYLVDANQVVIDIPGGDERVRDTIRVYSQVLKESQRLEIVF